MYNTVCLELKEAIIKYLIENKNVFQRVNNCKNEFKQYIYTPEGNYCINGEHVANFISDIEKLI